jgi:hypothetical protein
MKENSTMKRIRFCATCGDVVNPSFGKVAHVIVPPSAGAGSVFGQVIGMDGDWQIVRVTEPHLFHLALSAGAVHTKHGVATCTKCQTVSVVSQSHKLTTRTADGDILQSCPCGADLVFWPAMFRITK